VTTEGRGMVSSLGFISVLAFAGIVSTAGSILNVIFEDTAAQCRLSFLTRRPFGCFWWAGISAAWTFFISYQSFVWWQTRLDEDYATRWESVWFAYISTTTIGLGDFFLQPEVMFVEDLFRFSLLFLTGFVFLATFLGEIGKILADLLPNTPEKLRRRLQRTNILNREPNEEESIVSGEISNSRLELLRDMVNKEESDGDESRSMSAILEEEELLKKLLEKRRAGRLQMENVVE
jgi:hypothetical protein